MSDDNCARCGKPQKLIGPRCECGEQLGSGDVTWRARDAVNKAAEVLEKELARLKTEIEGMTAAVSARRDEIANLEDDMRQAAKARDEITEALGKVIVRQADEEVSHE